jgi:hypothetical protein
MIPRFPFVLKALFVGLCMAQILATIQVHLSSVGLYRSLVAIRDAGYLTIPNQRIMATLQGVAPAFFGGLFFTFSVGVGITLLTLGAAWLWDRLFSRNKLVFLVLVAIWAGCLVMVNIRGIDVLVSAYFLLVPCAILFAVLRWMPSRSGRVPWGDGIVLLGPVLVLGALWLTQIDPHLFLDIRDHLLLSNQLGTKLNDFYYAYTLYPAEVFKSLDQKALKTYHLEHIQDHALAASIERRLARHDYLRVEGDAPVDLRVVQKGDKLAFQRRDREVLEITAQGLFSRAGTLLRKFSERSDTHRFFRRFTFFSLLMGFPILLHVFLFSLFQAGIGLFLNKGTSSMCASAVCLAIGISLFAFFVHSRVRGAEIGDVGSALESRRWQERVAALKLVEKRGKELGDFPIYRSMLKSPRIPVRYWLARALGVSRERETFDDLLAFLDDPHHNVVSMAFYALGRRGEQNSVGVILQRIASSRHWYSQLYAYKALRRLGWHQTRLP